MEEIITTYRKRVFGYLFNYIKIRSAAEDLTQDVMVRLLENQDKLDQVRDMDSYILTIAHNIVMDHFKKLQRDKEYKEKVWETMQTSDRPILGAVFRHDFMENIERAVLQLPDRQQAVFRMNRLEGLSLDEIAKKLEISPYTVKNHLSEATRKIKNIVKPEYFLLILLLLF